MKERLYHYAKRVSLICILATQVGCAGLWVKEPTLYGADCDQSAKPAYLASAGLLAAGLLGGGLLISSADDCGSNQPGCSGYEGLIEYLTGYALMGGGAVAAASTAVDGGSRAADCRAYLAFVEREVLQRRAFTPKVSRMPGSEEPEDEASTDDTDTVEDISDGLTHPHAPIQDDASEPTPILPIKRGNPE